jgi:hypothetical protein
VKALVRRAAAVAGIGAFALLGSGCAADYDHTDINVVRSPPAPLTGNMNYARIQVSVGAIVTAHIVSYDDDRKQMDAVLRSKDTSIVEVAGVVSDHDYAFLGLRPGTTEVHLEANGKLVLILTAIVTDQPAP